jgi:hypothetical protein
MDIFHLVVAWRSEQSRVRLTRIEFFILSPGGMGMIFDESSVILSASIHLVGSVGAFSVGEVYKSVKFWELSRGRFPFDVSRLYSALFHSPMNLIVSWILMALSAILAFSLLIFTWTRDRETLTTVLEGGSYRVAVRTIDGHRNERSLVAFNPLHARRGVRVTTRPPILTSPVGIRPK